MSLNSLLCVFSTLLFSTYSKATGTAGSPCRPESLPNAIPCEDNLVCLFNPAFGVDCDPFCCNTYPPQDTPCEGDGCYGICVTALYDEVENTTISCGGFGSLECPDGYTCFDSPDEICSNNCGADCPGICVPDCELPPEVGPCRAAIPRYYFDPLISECLLFSYGGCGGNANNFQTMEQCLGSCLCSEPLEPDRGLFCGDIPAEKRYWYNSATDECEPFKQSSCWPNGNSFFSEKDCVDTCDKCLLPKRVGYVCDAAIDRYYFNYETYTCELFEYTGCDGNANNFETLEECEQECLCTLPLDTGNELCDGAIPRWYYNSQTDDCEEFIYTGCDGNANNFESEEACELRCGAECEFLFRRCYRKCRRNSDLVEYSEEECIATCIRNES